MSSNEVYFVLSSSAPATPAVRLVNGKATMFAAGLYDVEYDPLPAPVELQIRPYFNFDKTPWPSPDDEWSTVHTQTANGFAATIYLGGEWQVRAKVGSGWSSSDAAGVVIGTSVESK
jgi:hypothetical protein